MFRIIILTLATEHGWDEKRILQLLLSFIERKGQKTKEELISYLARAGKNEKDMKETKFE